VRIDSTASIAGHPALNVRELLRRGRVGEWGMQFVRHVLKVDQDEAARVIASLHGKGLIEPGESEDGEQLYQPSMLGRALANASAGKPIRRATADRLLSEFLKRVEIVNSDPHYLFRIELAVVFGSYLSDAEALGDLDLAIHLEAKEPDWDKHVALEDARIAEAREAGRDFPSYEAQIHWPETEVRRFLKGRSSAISLHDLRSDIRIITGSPHRVIHPPRDVEKPGVLDQYTK
jgi:hypothetical protein